MTDNLLGTWRDLGTVQPIDEYWSPFAETAVSGNDLIKVKFLYPPDAVVRGYAWLRCLYKLGNTTLYFPATRIYPKSEVQYINIPIPTDLRERGIINRDFEIKRSYYKPRYATSPEPYDWMVSLGELEEYSSASIWRVRNLEPATGEDKQWIVRELIFRDAQGTDITTGGSGTASGNTADANNAFDKNNITVWSGVTAVDGWLQYDFGRQVKVYSVSINNLSNASNIPPTSYVVENTLNSYQWNVIWRFTTGTNDNTFYNSSR